MRQKHEYTDIDEEITVEYDFQSLANTYTKYERNEKNDDDDDDSLILK